MSDTSVLQPARTAEDMNAAIRVMNQQQPPPNGKKPKLPKQKGGKSGKIKIIGLVVVLLLATKMMLPKFLKPHFSAAHLAPNGQIIELSSEGGNGSITTNMSDGHLAQIGISMQMTTVASSKTEVKDEDALMGWTVQLLGQSTYSQLLVPSGRAQLGANLLGGYQRILGKVDGGEQVSAVYFTNFVLQ